MKLTVLLFLVGMLQVHARTFGQTVSLSKENAQLVDFFRTIQNQTDYHVICSSDILSEAPAIAINLKKVPLRQALSEVLNPLDLAFEIDDISIIVFKTPPVVISRGIVQQKVLSGNVTDSTGAPLIGVSVTLKERPTVGTITNEQGVFQLSVPENANTLVFQYLGFTTKELPIANRHVFQVTMDIAPGEMDDVVVVAFGTQKKKELVGSITTIEPDELKVPSSNLTTALAGRLSGVVAYQRSGEPGADDADFFIRGVTSFGYKKDPLILIDGIELSSTDLARMQVDDIAQFSILKDATATALYGARGANGVILITTKEGREGPTKFSVRFENSLSQPTRDIELADPITYMEMNNEAVRTRNPLAETPYPQSKIDRTRDGENPLIYPVTDWRSVLFKDYTLNKRFNLNASGGGKKARYYLAATFNQDNGILKVDQRNNFNSNIDLKTYQLRSNINVDLTKSTEIGVKLYGSFDDYTGPVASGAHFYRLAMRSDPVSFPPYYPSDEAHQYVDHILFGNTTDLLSNPYAKMVSGYREYNRSLMLAQFDVNQNLDFLTQGLDMRVLFNVSRYAYSSINRAYKPYWYQVGNYDRLTKDYSLLAINPDTGTEYLDFNHSTPQVRSTVYLQATTNYNRTFNEKHNISGLLVFLMQNQVKNYSETDVPFTLQVSPPNRNIGVSGRFTYAYDEKYFAEFDFGYNGSERFYKTNRFGFFPSAGLAWEVSNEPFWQGLKGTIDRFKLRGTYGLIGNDAIGTEEERFFYLSEVDMDNQTRGAVFGIDNTYYRDGVLVKRYSNQEITWENSYKANVGFDMRLFDAVDIIADVWKERRTNILMTRSQIPSTMGLSVTPRANIGEAEGKGLDFSIDYSDYFGSDFWIQGRANFTYAVSKYKVYEEPVYSNEPWKSRVGYNLSQRWGYIAERLFIDEAEVYNSPTQAFGETTMAGDIKYRDINGDGQITTLDQVPIGYPTSPEIVYGFGTSVGYKAFDFSVFFQGLARESFWLDLASTSPFALGSNSGMQLKNQVLQAYANDYWSESNPDPYALWPRLSTVLHDNNNQSSTWFMRNGSFLRLKSVELGYSFPQKLLNRAHMEKARIYISGTNLLTWSKFKLWDVEMAGDGLGYPIQRVFNVGVQVSF